MKETYDLRKNQIKNRMAFRTHLKLLNENNTKELLFIAVTNSVPKNGEQ